MSNKQALKTMTHRIKAIRELRIDGRCKHGMLPMQCSYCAGIPMPKYAQSTGAAFIRR